MVENLRHLTPFPHDEEQLASSARMHPAGHKPGIDPFETLPGTPGVDPRRLPELARDMGSPAISGFVDSHHLRPPKHE